MKKVLIWIREINMEEARKKQELPWEIVRKFLKEPSG